MQIYTCRCGARLTEDNSRCVRCNTTKQEIVENGNECGNRDCDAIIHSDCVTPCANCGTNNNDEASNRESIVNDISEKTGLDSDFIDDLYINGETNSIDNIPEFGWWDCERNLSVCSDSNELADEIIEYLKGGYTIDDIEIIINKKSAKHLICITFRKE